MVHLTPEQIAKLYEFIEEKPPEILTEKEISRVLVEIEKKFTPYYLHDQEDENLNSQNNKNILIIDDLEVSLFQLSKLLSKIGYNTYISRSYDETKDLFKKHNFDYILLDLFLPDPEDGLKLLKELKESEKTMANNTKIIVISGSDDKRLINQCFENGSDDFIRKTKEWHVKILDKLRNFDKISRGSSPEIKTTVEDEEEKIASIKVRNIYKAGVIDELKREAVNLSLSGFSKIILDLASVNVTSSEVLNAIVYIYKYCDNNKGSLKLCNANNSVSEALSFVFLDSIILIYKDKNSALNAFYDEIAVGP